jgi:hypothetical protein
MHYDVLNYDTQQGDKRAGVLLNELESLTHPTAFDYVGTFLLLAASVLTIFGLTDGSEGGGWYVQISLPPTKSSHLPDVLLLRSPQGSSATDRHAGHRCPSLPGLLLLRDSDRSRQRSDRSCDLADQECHGAHSGRPHALLLVVRRAVQLVDHHGVGLGSELDHDRRPLVRRPL